VTKEFSRFRAPDRHPVGIRTFVERIAGDELPVSRDSKMSTAITPVIEGRREF
jgi:hypothetical protein